MMTTIRPYSSPYNVIRQNKVVGGKIEINLINCGAAVIVGVLTLNHGFCKGNRNNADLGYV